MKRVVLLVTCEHGGNGVPRELERLFRPARAVLASHRGYDLGAAEVARRLSKAFRAPLFLATTSRLVVDLNRSAGHPRLFSEWTRTLPAPVRAGLVARYYTPHRHAVEAAVERAVRGGARVVHVAVHSFTPALDGVVRAADVALLYDPSRASERALSDAWLREMAAAARELRFRRNYPYRGTSDGLTTAIRRAHGDAEYVGLEIEMNQAALATARGRERFAALLVGALRTVLGHRGGRPLGSPAWHGEKAARSSASRSTSGRLRGPRQARSSPIRTRAARRSG